MRLAQITFHNAQNCGAVLQAWALQTVLERMGHEVFLPDCNSVGANPGHFKNINLDRSSVFNAFKWCAWYLLVEILSFGTDELKDYRFKRFLRKHLHLTTCTPDEVAEKCDSTIFGSDQIWNPKWTGKDTNHFLGECLPPKFPRIAYGISIGDTPLHPKDTQRIADAAQLFHAISLREPLAQELLCDDRGRHPAIVCDPTLLLEKDDYLSIASSKHLAKAPYLLFFSLRGNEIFERSVLTLAKQLNLPCIIINMSQRGLWRCRPNTKIAVSPDLLLAYLRDADYVITDSFHGTALSLILGKKFLSLKVEDTSPHGRIATLLNAAGVPDRLIAEKDIVSSQNILTAPLPESISNALSNLRAQSLGWLKTSLAELDVP